MTTAAEVSTGNIPNSSFLSFRDQIHPIHCNISYLMWFILLWFHRSVPFHPEHSSPTKPDFGNPSGRELAEQNRILPKKLSPQNRVHFLNREIQNPSFIPAGWELTGNSKAPSKARLWMKHFSNPGSRAQQKGEQNIFAQDQANNLWDFMIFTHKWN